MSARPQRLLFWTPNYAPEPTGIAPLVTDACEWLTARGHEVEVVTAFPNYPQRRIADEYRGRLGRSEQRGAVRVRRSWLRVRPAESFVDKALYELTFVSCSLPRVVRRIAWADAVVCVVPSLLAAAAASAALRASSARFVVWLQDLVLEGARALDDLGPAARRLLGAAGRLETIAARRADRIVVCSPGFVPHLVACGADAERVAVLPNWVDVERIAPTPPSDRPATRFLYTGNIGYSQGLDTLIRACDLAGSANELVIVGDGNARAQVDALAAASLRTTVLAPVEHDAYPRLLSSADVHVVIQRAVSGGANLPSKIAPYLASGRPIVASLGLSTPAADLLRASGGALVVPPDSPEALAAAMRTLGGDAALRRSLAERGRRYAVEHLARDRVLTQFERELAA